MKKLLQSQKFPKEFLLSVFPNAGYQQEMQGRTQVFHDTAYYAGQMKEILALGANLVGGCCGTTPGHIRALKKVVQNQEQVWPKKLAKENENLGEVKDNPTPFIRKLRGGKKVFVVELDSAKEYAPCRKTEWTLLPFRILRWLAREQMLPFLPYMQKNARMWRLCRMWR